MIGKLLLLLPALLCARSEYDGPHDFQLWLHDSVVAPFTDRWNARAEVEFRFGDDASKLYYQHNQISLLYVPTPHFALEPTYRQTFERSSRAPTIWIAEYIPQLDMTFKGEVSGWKLSDRSRVQYVMLSDHSPTFWIYRNRIDIVSPYSWYYGHIVPAAFEEVFWIESRGIAQNRLGAGVQIHLLGKAVGHLYYILRNRKDATGWIEQNIAFLALKFHF